MKILLSAYVCGAGHGSEPGVGWNVARSLALRGHSVTVVSSPLFEEETRNAIRAEGLDIRLVTVPNDYKSNLFIKRHIRWQKAAASVISREVREQQVDVVHHVTFNQYRGLRDVFSAGVPYLIGPIGGAEVIPLPLLLHGGLSPMARVKELLRYVSADAVGMLRRCRAASARGRVLVSNAPTAERLNRGLFHLSDAAVICPAIAIADTEISETAPEAQKENPYFLLYASLKRAEKGVLPVLRAMALYRRSGGTCKLVIVGAPEEEHGRIAAMSSRMNIPEGAIEVHGFVERSRMLHLMEGAQAVLYTAYRDSGSMTVLEALAKGVPVICFDIPSQSWAPSEWVRKVPVPSSLCRISGLVKALAESFRAAENAPALSEASHRRRCAWLRKEMTWESRARRFEQEYMKLQDI